MRSSVISKRRNTSLMAKSHRKKIPRQIEIEIEILTEVIKMIKVKLPTRAIKQK